MMMMISWSTYYKVYTFCTCINVGCYGSSLLCFSRITYILTDILFNINIINIGLCVWLVYEKNSKQVCQTLYRSINGLNNNYCYVNLS